MTFKNFSFSSDLKINPLSKNLADSQKDMAIFLPSISAIYAKIVSMKSYKLREKMPAGLPNGLKDLDFLNPDNHLFYYPAALYSAGHAILDVQDSLEQESMVMQRDRKNTIIVGDSGGFQVATGVLKWPWEQKNKTLSEWYNEKDDWRLKILRWLEATSDYSQVLDFPTYGLVKFGLDPVTGESLHPGMKTFNDCLTQSLENHHYFIKHRKEGATKFMNVLQGRNQEEGDIWWEAVKDLPFETWSFSNVQASNFNINLRRLLIMRDTGYLENREWLHYLGNGKIKAGCALTTLQRTLRKYVDPNLTLSYDAASPFVMSSRGQGYEGYELSNRNMGFKGGSFVDDKSLKGNKELFNDWIARTSKNIKFLKRTNVGDRITVGDICVRGYEDLEYKKVAWTKKELETDAYKNSPEGKVGDQFRWSKEYHDYLTHHSDHGGLFNFSESRFEKETEKYQVKWPSSMDGFSYLLSMCHNCELHIQAIQEANNWQDQELHIANQHVTPDLLEFKDLCPEIFKSERPMDLIARHTTLLQNITGMNADNQSHIDLTDF